MHHGNHGIGKMNMRVAVCAACVCAALGARAQSEFVRAEAGIDYRSDFVFLLTGDDMAESAPFARLKAMLPPGTLAPGAVCRGPGAEVGVVSYVSFPRRGMYTEHNIELSFADAPGRGSAGRGVYRIKKWSSVATEVEALLNRGKVDVCLDLVETFYGDARERNFGAYFGGYGESARIFETAKTGILRVAQEKGLVASGRFAARFEQVFGVAPSVAESRARVAEVSGTEREPGGAAAGAVFAVVAVCVVLLGAGVAAWCARAVVPRERHNRYLFVDEGRQGVLSDVFTVKRGRFGRAYIFKRLRDVRVKDRLFRNGFVTECMILQRLTAKRFVWAPKVADVSPDLAAAIAGADAEGGNYWYVMSRIDGVSLETLIAHMEAGDYACDVNVRLRLLCRLARAVDRMHRLGVAHRDLSPDNVLVTRLERGNPEVALIDFGSGLLIGEKDALESKLVLKDGYAPPEQFVNLGHAGAPADDYALGVMCYEVLRGKHLFSRPGKKNTKLDHANLNRDYLAARLAAKSGVDARVAEYICKRLMCPDAAARGNAGEFLRLVFEIYAPGRC